METLLNLYQSVGDTGIHIASSGLVGPELGDDAPVLFLLCVSVLISTSDPAVLSNHAFHAITFDSTAGELSDTYCSYRAIFSALEQEQNSEFADIVLPWLLYLSGVASSQARSGAAAGFLLFAHIYVYCSAELCDAAYAIGGRIELSDDGVFHLTGGECIETVELSTGDESEEEEEGCPICFEGLAGEAVRMMDCSHVFHRQCLYRWLETNQSCPLCRRSAVAPGRAGGNA